MAPISTAKDRPRINTDKKWLIQSEREEMLREDEEAKLGERRPFESSRQATYEDTAGHNVEREWEQDERDPLARIGDSWAV